MEHISAQEFLKQPKEVQKAFLDWYKPQIGDLAIDKYSEIGVVKSEKDIKALNKYKGCGNIIPLFTEGQLRKFIEDKTKETTCTGITCGGDRFIETENENFTAIRREQIMDKDLLMAYWKYACRLIKEGLHD